MAISFPPSSAPVGRREKIGEGCAKAFSFGKLNFLKHHFRLRIELTLCHVWSGFRLLRMRTFSPSLSATLSVPDVKVCVFFFFLCFSGNDGIDAVVTGSGLIL
jgi:hypothetical protein